MANRYDIAAPYEYVPIPFKELFALAKYQQDEANRANAELNANVRKFGSFQSPSAIDTQNYYNESIGKLQPLIEQASRNPSIMKSAGFRQQLQNAYNTINYANLAMLQESADNLREGQKIRAKMKAENAWKKSWDLSDIANYDTLAQKKVFDDISPVRYLNANQISNSYYDNLKAGDLGHTWIDGVRYRKIGNNTDDLETIYSKFGNDMMNSSAGQMHIRDFMLEGATREEAEEKFKNMIIGSQMDRVIRPQLVVDSGYYTALNARNNGANNQNYSVQQPTRQTRIGDNIVKAVNLQLTKLPAKSFAAGLDKKAQAVTEANDYYNYAKQKYEETGSNKDLIEFTQAGIEKDRIESEYQSYTIGSLMTEAFNQQSEGNFKLSTDPQSNKNYSRQGYLSGVESALDAISGHVAYRSGKEGDELITRDGGIPKERITSDGNVSYTYKYNTSEGFVLPETIFQMATKTNPVKVKRGGSDKDDAGVRQAIERGLLTDVEFLPDLTGKNMFILSEEYINDAGIPSYTGKKYVRGKLRISKQQLEDLLGTGIWLPLPSGLKYRPDKDLFPFGQERLSQIMKEQYNAKTIKYGENGEEYWEIDINKPLPNDADKDYWPDVNSQREGTVISSAHAKDMQPTIVYEMNQYGNN